MLHDLLTCSVPVEGRRIRLDVQLGPEVLEGAWGDFAPFAHRPKP